MELPSVMSIIGMGVFLIITVLVFVAIWDTTMNEPKQTPREFCKEQGGIYEFRSFGFGGGVAKLCLKNHQVYEIFTHNKKHKLYAYDGDLR